MTSLQNEEVFAELYYTRKIIKDVTGVTPRCWRPAQGDVDNRVRVIAAGLNMTNILWDAETVCLQWSLSTEIGVQGAGIWEGSWDGG